MSEISQKTDAQNPGATGGDNPAATNPQGGAPATGDTTIPEGFELIRTEDKNNLISARDRATNANGELGETVATLAQEREERAKKELIGEFLESNKEKYPDLTTDDLMSASSPEELDDLAAKRQRRYEDIVQEKLLKVQKTSDPILSPEQKAEKLKTLKENPGSSSFQSMLEIQQS